MISVVLADDEPLAREGAVMLLSNEADVEIVAVCENGKQAVQAIRQHKPDLVLLDIHMPGMSGLEVVKEVGIDQMPKTIFLTAHDKYALDAFEVYAFDYLLKPVDTERFKNTLSRVRSFLNQDSDDLSQEKLKTLLEHFEIKSDSRIMVRSAGHVYFLSPAEITMVLAEGDYVTIKTPEKSHLVRETLTNMEAQLQAYSFQRVHRSSLVNMLKIQELVTDDNGEYVIIMKDGDKLRLSRSYRDALYSRMIKD